MITLAKTLSIIIIITSHKIFDGYGYLVRSIILNRTSGIYIRLLAVCTRKRVCTGIYSTSPYNNFFFNYFTYFSYVGETGSPRDVFRLMSVIFHR